MIVLGNLSCSYFSANSMMAYHPPQHFPSLLCIVDRVKIVKVVQPFISPNNLPLAPVSQAASYTPGSRADSNRLNAYLLRHNQMARTAGRQGFVSFVPIVATPVVAAAEATEEGSESKQSDSKPETVRNK